MSVMGQSLNNWLQRQGASVMRQEADWLRQMALRSAKYGLEHGVSDNEILAALQNPRGRYGYDEATARVILKEAKSNPGQEVTVCDRFPEHTRGAMIAISEDSAFKEREMGAPITMDYTLGKVLTGTREKVLIPRPADTIGTYHTHPHGSSFPSPNDTLVTLLKDDKISCIGATGYPGTKIQCFTPGPKWSEFKERFNRLVSDISVYNKKIGAKFKGMTALEMKLNVATREPEWAEEGDVLVRKRKDLEDMVKLHLRYLKYPEEWRTRKWVDGFEDMPFSEAYPNIFDKCKLLWETFEEELPVEL